jgi:hypothetical protein
VAAGSDLVSKAAAVDFPKLLRNSTSFAMKAAFTPFALFARLCAM